MNLELLFIFLATMFTFSGTIMSFEINTEILRTEIT